MGGVLPVVAPSIAARRSPAALQLLLTHFLGSRRKRVLHLHAKHHSNLAPLQLSDVLLQKPHTLVMVLILPFSSSGGGFFLTSRSTPLFCCVGATGRRRHRTQDLHRGANVPRRVLVPV